jgi:hypothetical protein
MMRDQDTGDLNDWLPKQPVNPPAAAAAADWLHSLCPMHRMHRRACLLAYCPQRLG